jgi:hypothetical protein
MWSPFFAHLTEKRERKEGNTHAHEYIRISGTKSGREPSFLPGTSDADAAAIFCWFEFFVVVRYNMR